MLSTTLRSLATPTRRIRAPRRRNQKAFRPSLAMMEDRLLLSSFPNGSVNVAIIGGTFSNFNGGTMPIGIPPLSSFNFTQLNNTAVNQLSDLAAYDTVILNVSGTLGMNSNVNNLSAGGKQALVDFVGSGHKLIIYDPESPPQDYSWLPYSFSTSNPGAQGATGALTVVEDNTLASNKPSSPYYIDANTLATQSDAVGDANVMVSLDSHWFVNMTAKNILNQTGPVHTYSEYSTPGGTDTGLMIYNGLDTDYFDVPGSTGYTILTKIMDQELAQPFDPSGLQGTITVTGINLTPGSASDTVGGTHTVTTTITDQLGNPQPNIHVTFAVTAGPNAGVVGVTSPLNGNTNTSGQVTFTYTSNGVAGTDTIIAQFTNAANQVITSQPVTETWTQPSTVATTTNLTSDVNPSPFGQLVTFSATVTPNGGGGTPTTGSVEFFDGSTSLGVVNLSGGPVSVSTNSLTVGTHTITAKYSGGTGFDPSQATLSQVVNQASTTTALASSQNPSTVGQPVTLTASVSSAGGTPTGSVEFFDGSTSLGVVNLSGGTAALPPTSALTAGSHGITAVYSGDPNFLTSQGTLTQTVTYATTLLGDYSKPKESGSTLPVKLEVADYNGVNLSSPDLAVTAVGIAPAGSSAPTMPAEDAGQANPGGLFRNVSSGYIFNLKLVDAMGNGLAAGDYTLFFTIGDDPTLHTFGFSVKKK